MLSQIIDVILYPVKEFLKLLVDERITSYLGVSPMAIAVTCMITLIVFNSLVSTVSSDVSLFANQLPKKKVDWAKRNKEIAKQSGYRNGVKRK